MSTIGTYVFRLIVYCLIVFAIYSIYRFLYLKLTHKKPMPIVREIVTALFVSYLFGILSQTIFPLIRFDLGTISCCFPTGNILRFSLKGIKYIHENEIERSLNLIPFKTIKQYLSGSLMEHYGSFYNWKADAILNILGNIMLFMPIGFLLPLVKKPFEKLYSTVLFALSFSLIIETSQYFVGRGTDIDDLIMNTLGAILGFLIMQIPPIKKIAKKLCKID